MVETVLLIADFGRHPAMVCAKRKPDFDLPGRLGTHFVPSMPAFRPVGNRLESTRGLESKRNQACPNDARRFRARG